MDDKFSELNRRSLWMGNLDSQVDEQMILTAFEKMGQSVESVKFVRDKGTQARINSYCFLEFKDQLSAKTAMRHLNGKPLPNIPRIAFKLAPTKNGGEKEATFQTQRKTEYSLFVGNLSHDVDESSLINFFASRYATVKEARLCRNPDSSSKCFGFVRFFNEHDQQEALRRMNGVRGLGTNTLYVSKATPKPNNPRGKYEHPGEYVSPQDSQGYYQQSAASQYPQGQQNPYYGGETWTGQSNQNLQNQYPQQYDYNNKAYDTSVNEQQAVNTEKEKEAEESDDDEKLTDHKSFSSVDKMNEEFIQNNEELYSSLEKSRWNFVDSITTTIDDISTT